MGLLNRKNSNSDWDKKRHSNLCQKTRMNSKISKSSLNAETVSLLERTNSFLHNMQSKISELIFDICETLTEIFSFPPHRERVKVKIENLPRQSRKTNHRNRK